MEKNHANIALCGEGHGAIAAFDSLSDMFSHLEVMTKDDQLRSRLRSTDSLVDYFGDIRADVVVLAGYGRLIPENELRKRTFINTHPSKLPRYRGMHSVVWAMLNGEKEIGFTIHLVNSEMDDGDVLEQFVVDNRGQTSAEIWSEFDSYVRRNLARVVKDFLQGKILPQPQDRDEATWVPKRNLEDCVIDYNTPNWRLRALFRALVEPYPLPKIRVDEVLYDVIESEIWDRDYYATVGRVVAHVGQSALIKIAEGILCIRTVQKFDDKVELCGSAILPIGKRL